MKSAFLRIMLFAFSLLFLQACGGDEPQPTPPEPTAEEKATAALTGEGSLTWELEGGGKITKDGTEVTALYEGFELTLTSASAKTYSSKNNNELLDDTGTWIFAGTNFDKFILSGSAPAAGREISFTRTDDKLTLTFTVPAPSARIDGIEVLAGSYIFELFSK
ncbi:hypothetical protein PBT90_03830 [Algoriphagus halophytocola]|uniref:Lipocalin-like domain-containing protein n=1 Tax=Algoriphagus halophytocola TaxID=2991499 RepID=A0ABY6MJF6_9BACT|nr:MULTISPECIES: hypothetical protein [unclassified Algoriphagus]UZD22552.1 hypothetical protein OM944_18100 [Algoriphagus sp. TR-M5]WBL43815.1 hypothetical protein PBT90_03830 [Algoriphagus sp. TR-M9]